MLQALQEIRSTIHDDDEFSRQIQVRYFPVLHFQRPLLTVISKLFIMLLEWQLFSQTQTSCAFRSAHILLHVNVRNDDVVTEKNSNNFVVVTDNEMSFGDKRVKLHFIILSDC